jgi:hypothetical protein
MHLVADDLDVRPLGADHLARLGAHCLAERIVLVDQVEFSMLRVFSGRSRGHLDRVRGNQYGRLVSTDRPLRRSGTSLPTAAVPAICLDRQERRAAALG